PPVYYNFKQLPLVRGLDPLWSEQTEGNGKMTPAAPLDDTHMPHGSNLPILMSYVFSVPGARFISQVDHTLRYLALRGGMAFGIGCMIVRSLKDDHGYYIKKEELEREAEEG